MKKNFFRSVLALGCIFLLHQVVSPTPAPDQKGPWTSIGPDGGSICGIAINPTNSSEIYAVAKLTDDGFKSTDIGAGHLWYSSDSGATWKRLYLFTNSSIYDVALDPINPNTIYALGQYGVFKSTDKGATFPYYYKFETQKKAFGIKGKIAVNPAYPNIVCVAGIYYWDYTRGKNCPAFFKSVNGGNTWTITKLESNADNGGISRLAISPADPNLIYVGGDCWCGSTHYDRVYKSANGGETWKVITGSMKYPIKDIVPHPTNPKKVYVATNYGVYRSTNGGSSWKFCVLPPNMYFMYVGALAISPSRPKILYAGSSHQLVPNFYKSVNEGVNWTYSTTGVYGACNILRVSSDRIISGSTAGIFTSTDHGLTLSSSSTGMEASFVEGLAPAPSAPETIYAGIYTYALFKTTDSGGTWQKLPDFPKSANIHKIAVHPTDPATVFVIVEGYGMGDDVYKSVDGGNTMTNVLHNNCGDILINDANPDHIFIAGQASVGNNLYLGLHKSLDGGKTWKTYQINSDVGSDGSAVAIDSKNDNTIYVAGNKNYFEGMVYKTTDGGKTWKNITASIEDQIDDIAVDPDSPKTVFVKTWGEIWKSTDGGLTWTKYKKYVNGSCILVNPSRPAEAFVGGDEGVYYTKDGGAKWIPYNSGLIAKEVRALAINPSARILYAATYGNGICKIKF